MYEGGFSHDDLSQVVEVNGYTMIKMTANSEKSLRSREKQ